MMIERNGETAEIKAQLEKVLDRLDALELHQAGAFVSMAIHCLDLARAAVERSEGGTGRGD